MASSNVSEVNNIVSRYIIKNEKLDVPELVDWWRARGHNINAATWTTTLLLEVLYLQSMSDDRVRRPGIAWVGQSDYWHGREVRVNKLNSVLQTSALANMVYWRHDEVWSGLQRIEDMDCPGSWPDELSIHKEKLGILQPEGPDKYYWFTWGMLGAMSELASGIGFTPFDDLHWTKDERMAVQKIAWEYKPMLG